MTATTIVEILGKDNTKQAFDSVSRGLGNIESAAISARNTVIGLAAGLVSIQSAKALVDAALDVQKFNNALVVGLGSIEEANSAMDFLRKTSEELGLDLRSSAEQFSKLAAAAKGTALEGQATRDIFLGISKAATALGLSSDEAGGALLAIQQIVSKGKVSLEELSGQLGERLPGALQIAARSLGLTTQELNKLVSSGNLTAEQLLPALAAELEKTFGTQSQQAAQGLQSQINRFNTALFDLKVAIGETGLIDFLSEGIQLATRFANALSGIFGKSEQLSAIDKQKAAIAGLREELAALNDKKNIPVVGELLFDKKEADLLEQRIDDAVADLAKLESASAKVATQETKLVEPTRAVGNELAKISKATKSVVSDSQKFLEALIKEASQSGKSQFELKRLEAAKLGVLQAAGPLIDALERESNALRSAEESANQYRAQLARAAGITESVMTDSEKFAQTQAELNSLYQQGFISLETYNRALVQARGNFVDVGKAGTSAFDDISQFSIQAARNIQTSLADALLEGIKGFDNFASAALNIVKRLAAEIASVKLLQGLGLGGTLGLGATSAAASTGGLGALNIASLGSSALNLFGSGFGATSAISSIGSLLPGAAGSFFTGFGLSGGGAAASAAGFSGAASLGASIGSFAGPAIALAVADQIGRLLAGDKSTGTFVDSIPVIGGFAGALFGRGPYKFREQQILGNVSAGGFEGEVSDVFRSKGGLLVGNKHRRQGVENEDALLELFDATIKGFADSTKAFADTLGLDADSIDDYTKKIFIRSEKGQRFTEEAINEFVTSIGDDFAGRLIPTIDELSLSGESAFNTLQRLSSEFELLQNAAVLFGDSAEIASEKIKSLGLGGTTDLINQFGGAEKLSAEISEFYATVFTESQKLEVVRNRILDVLQPLGIDFIPTLEQLYDAIRSGNPDLINAALQIDTLVAEFNGLSEAVDQADAGAILNERISLEERLLQLQGDTAAIRQRELDALDASNRPLLERIFALEDERSLNASNQAILSERASLQRAILQLEGDTAALRKLEIDALDPSNRALQERIFLLQDEQIAAQESAQNKSQMQSTIREAFGVLQTAVSDELRTVSDRFRDLISGIDASIKSTTSSISRLSSVSEALKGTVEQIRGVTAQEARGQIQSAILSATQGNAIDLSSIRGALSSLGSRDTSGFRTREEFARQTGSDASLVDKLNDVVVDQLSVEEQTLATLEDQKIQLQEQFDVEQQTLNKILDKAQGEIDAILGVDKSLNTLLGKKSPFVASISSIAASVGQLVRDYKDAFGAEGFASGGFHSGGLRIVGENGPELELTGSSRIISNSELANLFSRRSGSVNIDFSSLEKSINRMNELMERVVEYTRYTSDTLSRVSDDGLSLRTTAA